MEFPRTHASELVDAPHLLGGNLLGASDGRLFETCPTREIPVKMFQKMLGFMQCYHWQVFSRTV